MDASGDAMLVGSPWCTPDRKHERDSPPETTPYKVLRVDSQDGSSRVPLDGVASGGTPLTTTASTARTVATHIDGSPTFPPDSPGPSVEGAANLLRLQQAQLKVVDAAYRAQSARSKLAQRSSAGSFKDDGSDKASISSKRAERRADRRWLPPGPFRNDERFVFIRERPSDKVSNDALLSLIHI